MLKKNYNYLTSFSIYPKLITTKIGCNYTYRDKCREKSVSIFQKCKIFLALKFLKVSAVVSKNIQSKIKFGQKSSKKILN